MIYGILSTFSGSLSLSGGSTTSTNSLTKFSLIRGDWWIYLIMSLLMEYVVAVVYMVVGTKTPLNPDGSVDNVKMQGVYAPQQAYAPQPGTYYNNV